MMKNTNTPFKKLKTSELDSVSGGYYPESAPSKTEKDTEGCYCLDDPTTAPDKTERVISETNCEYMCCIILKTKSWVYNNKKGSCPTAKKFSTRMGSAAPSKYKFV